MYQIEIDGEVVDTCTLAAFVASNETLSPEEIDALDALPVGATYGAGGGAAVEWSARRVA